MYLKAELEHLIRVWTRRLVTRASCDEGAASGNGDRDGRRSAAIFHRRSAFPFHAGLAN